MIITYSQNKCDLALNVESRVLKLQPHFIKDCSFFSCNTFSILMYGYLLELILEFLTFGDNGVRVLAGSFLKPNLLRNAQKPIFSNGKHLFLFIDKFLKFKEKFEMWPILCKFPILFSVVKLKLGHYFSQFIHRFQSWTFQCWS